MHISLYYRLSEQKRLSTEQKRLVAEIHDKLQEYQAWNVKYNVSTVCPPFSLSHSLSYSPSSSFSPNFCLHCLV